MTRERPTTSELAKHAQATADIAVHPTRRGVLRKVALLGAGAAALGISPSSQLWAKDRNADVESFDAEVPLAWFGLAGTLVQSTPGFSPPVASRAFGYAGVTLYETIVPGMKHHRSLEKVLSDFPQTEKCREKNLHWPTAANAALAAIVRSLFPTTAAANLAAIDSLERSFEEEFSTNHPLYDLEASKQRGRSIAATIFEWSKLDGGHEGYLRNFPADYVPPKGPGLWVPTSPGFQPALQPTWGKNRTFVVSADEVDVDAPPSYSESKHSKFTKEAREVYDVSLSLTDEQRAIARFWSDDPGQTATPPGHSVSILSQVLSRDKHSLATAAEAFARLGIAVTDSFVCCWHTKYHYNFVRPITILQQRFNAGWLPYLGTPPFPEYTSGHSVQSAAAAEVMTGLFGDLPFTDQTHSSRGLAPRSFASFRLAAKEAAVSRLYGGIHFRAAVDLGLRQGRRIGAEVRALRLSSRQRD